MNTSKAPAIKAKSRARKQHKTSRTRKPSEMSLEEWQIALRREFGSEQKFQVKPIGDADGPI